MERAPELKQNRPNIIFILADDLGYGDFGCFGATQIPTPNVDSIAEQGLRFTDCHSSSAVCSPSRYSILTGRYCWRTRLKTGVLRGYDPPLIEPDRLTLPRLLKNQGYHTAAIGKWHVGLGWQNRTDVALPSHYPRGDRFHLQYIDFSQPIQGGPTALGFDYYYGISGSLDMPPYTYIENDRTIGIPTGSKTPLFNQQAQGPISPGWKDDEVDITLAKKAVEFIDRHMSNSPEQPFFLYHATAAPHRPCDCRPDFVIGKSQAGDRGDMVVLFDWVVGQILNVLERHGIREKTLIFVTSDNGAQISCANGQTYGHSTNGPLRGQKADIFEGGHRVPMVCAWPHQISPKSTCNELISLMDLIATFADYFKIPLQDTEAEDAMSFLPYLSHDWSHTPTWPHEPVRSFMVQHSSRGLFALRQKQWKMVPALGSGGYTHPRFVKRRWWRIHQPDGQLYDLHIDLQETRNLWRENTDLTVKMNEKLEKVKLNPVPRIKKE